MNKQIQTRRFCWAAAAVAVLLAPVTFAQNGRAIAETAQERSTSKSEHYEGTLEVVDSSKRVSTKEWTFDRIGSHGNSKALIHFTAPAEVKGVALLIANRPDQTSNQWMWTPALERTRRVAVQNRAARFFGTDFSFEDLDERDVDQFSYKLLGEERHNGADCWKLEATPMKDSQYDSSHMWIQKSNYALLGLDHFQNGKVVRQIVYGDLEQIQGIWTPKRVEVRDLKENSTTVMTIRDVRYDAPMKDSDFTTAALRRLK